MPIARRSTVFQWLLYGGLIFVTSFTPLLMRPDELSTTEPNVPVTMAFAVSAFGAIFGV